MPDISDDCIVLATRNAGKIRELAIPLAAYDLKVVGLDAFPSVGEIEENGATFAQNALIKARVVAGATGHVAIADDSGLVVDVLNGRPGVYSARYSDDWESLPDETRDQRNMRKLLHEMEGVPVARRACAFVTCMACVRPDGRELTVEGHWDGQLLTSPRGENGFGYDPVFFDPEIGRSAAELTREEKTERSHRGKAMRGLLARLEGFLELPELS